MQIWNEIYQSNRASRFVYFFFSLYIDAANKIFTGCKLKIFRSIKFDLHVQDLQSELRRLENRCCSNILSFTLCKCNVIRFRRSKSWISFPCKWKCFQFMVYSAEDFGKSFVSCLNFFMNRYRVSWIYLQKNNRFQKFYNAKYDALYTNFTQPWMYLFPIISLLKS